MSGDGKSTVVDRPQSDRPDDPTSKRSGRRSIPPSASPGTARYTGGDEIGRGGMGRVVEATDTLLDRRVAVKEALTTDPELLRRFARETKITARLEHPSIVPVYDAGIVDGAPFYVMRRVSGRPLSDLIRHAPSLNERLALVPHLLAAAQAIAHAHQRGIIHRDIKPSNILVGELGETVVIDWGLAKVIGEADDDEHGAREPDPAGSLRTRLGVVFGTPGFMDPTQLRGEPVGPQGDVYSLGASLYNLLAAEPPHYAKDSTQMMTLAAQGPPTPLSQRVPGVPAELTTIVDTATDYDVARRYRDAGAFAEDLKRFLAGQLVASHRYSRTERFVRFVRRHRAAVAIGSASIVLLAAIGVVAVSQVVGERDRADAQRREAEAARATADERADQLLLARARALVDTNPTAALASLKQLSRTSKRLDEAWALARAARTRGVAWAMKAADAQTTFLTLDPRAQRLAQMSTDGILRVYDLEARRSVFDVEVGRGAQPRWILDGTRLVVGGVGATRMFDGSGKELPTDLPALDALQTDERGLVLVATDRSQRALRIDLAQHTTTVLAERAQDVMIGPDGRHAAVVTDNSFLVFDAANTVILRRPQRSIARVVVTATKVALLEDGTIFEAPLAAGAPWTERLLPGARTNKPYWFDYAGDRLFATYTDARVAAAQAQGVMREIGSIGSTSGVTQPFGHDYLALGGDGRRIYYVDGARMRELYLPIALHSVRLVARRDQPRIVAVGDGAIVVLDLSTLPRLAALDRYATTLFMNERTLLASQALMADYAWHDLASRRSAPFATIGPAELRTYDRDQGRLAVVETTSEGPRGLVFTVGETEPTQVVEKRFDLIQVIGGGGLLYAAGNKVYGGVTSFRELFTTNGDVRILVRLAETRFAVVADHELVRGDLRTSELERIALPDGAPVQHAVGDRGELLFVRDDRLWKWQHGLVELARVEAAVDYVHPVEHGIVVRLATHATMFVGRDGRVTRLASTRGIVLASPDRVIVPGQIHYDVIELPSLARWSLPITRTGNTNDMHLDISPSGTQLVERADDGRIWLWRLPVAEDFAAALEATNLSEDQNGLMLWPWQSPAPKK